MAWRVNYWSCSKLADKILELGGCERKPIAATMEGWDEWKSRNKDKLAYRIVEEWLDKIQDFINWPMDKINGFVYWIDNRFVNKTHAVVTSLEKGSWHESETLMLHANFQILVDFVREQKAWMQIKSEKSKLHNYHWTKRVWPFYRFRKLNDEEAGLEYLDWEMSLTFDDNWGYEKDDENFGKPTHQALAAMELCSLYHWWVYVRPNRIDPYDEPHYTNIKEKFGEKYYEEIGRIEEAYEQEDEDMMIRLIKVRRNMWT